MGIAANYAALSTQWAQLTPGTTTAKLTQLNAMTITGSVPTTMMTTTDAVLNCVVWSEFAALTAVQQTNFLMLCTNPGKLLGGSANLTRILPGMIVAYFGGGSGTVTNLSALAAATVQPWWQSNGFSQPIGTADLTLAGGLT